MTTISEIPEISITKVIRCDSDEEALNVNVKNVLTDCENLDSDDDDTADDCKTNLKGKHMKKNRYRSASGDGTAVGAGTNRHKEVDDSGSDDDNNISISPLLRIKRKPREKNIEDTYTDIEDYNDSDDEDNCINNSINNEVNDNEDMKISINELLDQGFIEESKNLSLECGGKTGTKITTENRNYLNVKSNKNCKNIDDENDDDKDDGGVTDCENVEESDDQLGDNDNYDNYIKINDIKYDDILTLVEENSNKICIQDSIDVCNVPKSAISSESENDEQQPNNSLKLNNRVIYDTSDIENLMFSNDNDDDDDDDDDGNDNDNRYCGRLKHSLSTFAAEEIMLHSSDSEVNSYDDNDGAKSLPPQSAGTNQKQTNIPVFDIQFIRDEKTILRQRKLKKFQHNHQKKSTSNGKNNSNSLLNVKSTGSPQNINENHTDIENLHTSTEQSQTSSSDTSDYDSDFNNFNKNEKSYKSDKLTIPVAVVKTQPLTDMEDFDDNNENDDTGYNNNNLYDIQKYKEIVLPSPTREIIIIVEANHGGPILKVMPLPTNVKIVKLQDEYIDKGFTDCEDFSCNEEILEERKFSIIDNVPIIDTNTIVNTSEKFRKSIEEQQPPSSSSSSSSTSSLSSSAIAKKKKQQSQHHHHHHHHHHHYHHHKKQHPKLYKSSGSNTVIDHHTLEPKTDIEEIQLNLNARRKKIKSKSLSASNTANKNTTSTGTLLKSKSYEKHLNKRKIGKPTTDIEELDAVSDNEPENRKQYTKQQGEIFGNTLNINYVGCKSHGHNESGDINNVLTDIEMLAVDENISDADNCSLEDNIKIKEIDTSIIEEQIYNSVVTSYDTLDVTNETRKKFQNTPMPILPNISTLVDGKNSILTNCKDVTGDDEEKIEEIQQLKVTTIIAIDNVSTAITTGIADIDVIAPLDISTPIDLKNTLHECNNTIVFDKTNEGHQNIKGHEYPDVITEHEIITEDCGECNEVVDDGDIVNVSGSGSGTSVGDIIDIGEEVHVDEETTKNDAKLDEIMHETSDSAKAKGMVDYNNFIRNEAINLVDSVLEQSIIIINSQQQQQQQQYTSDTLRSESEHFAITCDLNGIDLIKSPTIESMSGKSFDDNLSVPDDNFSDIVNNTNNNINNNNNNNNNVCSSSNFDTDNSKPKLIINNDKKYERIERKFERLSSQVLDIDFDHGNNDQYQNEFDMAIMANINSKDDVNNLQSDFSKISWDESVSGTTTADLGLSTPDNDLQDFLKEPGIHSTQTFEIIPKPTPRLTKPIASNVASITTTAISSLTTTTTTPTISTKDVAFQQADSSIECIKSDDDVKHKDNIGDRSSGDYTETKKFWENLDTTKQGGSSDSSNIDESIMPIPKPRTSQIITAITSIPTTTSATIILTGTGKFDEDLSQTTSSSKISSEQQVEYSETSSSLMKTDSKNEILLLSKDDDDSIDVCEEKLDDESYPLTLSDRHKSDIDIIKMEEIITFEKKENIDDRKSTSPVLASFYIGESSGDIIKKTPSSSDLEADKTLSEKTPSEYKAELTLDLKFDRMPSEDHKLKQDLNLKLDKSETEYLEKTSCVKKLEDDHYLIEAMEDFPPRPQKAAVVHSPIQPYKSATEYEKSIEIQDDTIIASKLQPQLMKSATILADVQEVTAVQSDWNKINDSFGSSTVTAISTSFASTTTTATTKIDQSIVEKTFAEVKESLDAVQEDLIEVVQDGRHIKQSPSEFEFKILPNIRYPPQLESHQEESPEKNVIKSKEQQHTEESIITSPKQDTTSSSSSIKVKSTNRWSTTDPDNYSASSNSYYESFEKTDNSRPLSSDVENLLTFGNSSEYQTAQDASSLLPSIGNRNGFGRKGGESMGSSNTTTTTTTTTITSDFYTAHGTIDNSSSSGQTLSSHESMKSFDSESSGHLGSIEISEASETLVPSTMDIDLPCDTTHSDSHFDIDDNELKLSSLEACSGILLEDYNNELEPISSCMKRSQEMIFQQESKPISLESFDTTKRDSKDDTYNDDKKYSFDDKFGSSYDESKIGTSLEDCGSVLSMSLSSQSNVDTVVELNQQLSEDMASSFGSSLIGSYELKSMLRDDIITAATSFEEPCSLTSMERIDNLIMTTSIVQDGDINSVNTQITTTTTTAPPSIIGDIIQFGADSMNDQINNKKSKGHKRTDSTTFLKGLETVGKPTVAPPPPPPTTTTPITTPTTTTSKEQPPSSSDFSLDDEMIIHDDNDDHFNENEPLSQKDYSGDEKKGGNESDSDYDRYETEYSRSFKQPTKQRDLRGKKNINEKIVEVNTETLERKKSIPSIETIVEDIAAEIELDPTIEQQSLRKSQVSPSQNMQDYSNIPDIKITDDPTKYIELETKVTKQFVEPKGEAIILEKIEPKGVQSPVQYARESVIKVTEEEYQDMIEKQYKAKVADMTTKFEFDDDEKGGESPTSDSFEMLEQPDIADEFVIIEEVAKEANEFDAEGKSVSIKHLKYVKKHDEDVETILVKSAPAATNEGSIVYQQRGRNDLGFEFEESPPQGGGSGGDSTGDSTNGSIDSSRKWVEMQLVDQAQNLRYQYDMERGILEDIKEEDTDFEVGSSRISSFKDSYSSSTPDYDAMAARRYYAKEHDDVSMSSLQEFESLEQAISLENRKFHQGSQDSLSNGSYPKRHVARSGPGDDISLSSLKEFEGLENACLEAHLIEIKAKEEAALLLSRSDESNKSNKSDKSDKGNKFDRVGESDRSQIIKTNITGGVAGGNINRTVTTKITSKDNGDGKTKIIEERIITTTPTATSSGGTGSVPFLSGISTQKPIDNFIKQKCDDDDDLSSNLMEISSDSLEIGTGATAITGGGASISGGTGGGSYSKQQKTTYSKDTSHHGSNDSLDISKSVGDIMTSSMDSIEISKEKSSSKSEADSIEQLCDRDSVGDDNTVDSIEKQYALMEHATRFDRDSIDSGKVKFDVHTTVSTSGNQTISTKTITSTTSKTISFDLGAGTSSTIAKDISTDSLNIMQSEPELLLTSTESLDRSSSTAATNATYQNESDSQMSGSMTSCGSNTLIDTLDGTSNYSMDMYQASSSSTSSTTATTIQYGGSGSGCGIGDGDELTSLKTSVYRTRTKDGDKPYEFFEIFDKDYDKTDTLPRKKGDVPEERREPKND